MEQSNQNLPEAGAATERKQESVLLIKVRDKMAYFGILALLFGFLFCYCFHDFLDFSGGTVVVIFAVSSFAFLYLVSYGLEFRWNRRSLPGILAALLLVVSSWRTDSGFLHFFNMLGFLILFTRCIFQQFYRARKWRPGECFLNGVVFYCEAIISCFKWIPHLRSNIRARSGKRAAKMETLLKGVLLSVPVLIVVLYLLSEADLVFKSILEWIFKKWVFSAGASSNLFFIAVGFLIFYGFLYSIAGQTLRDGEPKACPNKDPGAIVIAAGAAGAVYLLFSMIQILFLFGGGLFELPDGMNYSSYARQGFFQLLFLVVLNLLVVLFCLYHYADKKNLRVVLTIICGGTFVMTASSAYRMMMYVEAYQMTFLRILVLWFLALLAVLLSGVTYYIYKRSFPLYRFGFTAVMAAYLILSLARPDSLVANYNISQGVESKVDYHYLLSLSRDAYPAILSTEEGRLAANGYLPRYVDPLDFRSFNWSRYQAQVAMEQAEVN